MLTLEHYPKTDFCCDKHQDKFYRSKTLRKNYLKNLEKEKKEKLEEESFVNLGIEGRICLQLTPKLAVYVKPGYNLEEVKQKYLDRKPWLSERSKL